MPTIIAHAAVGGCLARFTPADVPTGRLALTLAVLAIVPDADVLAFQLGYEYGHALGHRGFTHSITFALLIALAATWLLCRNGTATRSKLIVYLLCCVAATSHGVLDAFTDAGLGVGFFIPFDSTRYFFPWRPIATSPLSVAAFFDGPALRILANEAFYIGMPLLGVLGLTFLIRRHE
ncbi:MAG: metal-dependent hydrolase [Pseudomonadales bacterium]